MSLDATDRRLLALLQENGKTSNANLGAEVGLSVSSVNERVRKLQELGYIRQFSALLDPQSLGLGLVAFVQILTDDVRQAKTVEAAIEQIPEVQECHFVTGEYSYLLKIVCKDTSRLQSIIQDQIQTIKSVVRTNTVIALSSPKVTAAFPTEA